MPEGDTIHRTAVALRTAVLGKPVTAFEAPRLAGLRPSIGAVIERVESRGKHLEIGFDDGVVLHTHMRMTGSWHLYRAGEQWRKSIRQARVIIEVPGWQAVCFSAPVVRTYRAKEFLPNPRLASLGPDLCDEGTDLDACVRRMGELLADTVTVAEALLDQRIACGVGNVYKSEVLWVCELHPATTVGALDVDQRRALLATAARLLQDNLGRPSRVTVPGVPGGKAVYGRHAKPCFRCGTPIDVDKHGEHARVTYWCPACQLYLAPPEAEPDPADQDGLGVDAGEDADWSAAPPAAASPEDDLEGDGDDRAVDERGPEADGRSWAPRSDDHWWDAPQPAGMRRPSVSSAGPACTAASQGWSSAVHRSADHGVDRRTRPEPWSPSVPAPGVADPFLGRRPPS